MQLYTYFHGDFLKTAFSNIICLRMFLNPQHFSEESCEKEARIVYSCEILERVKFAMQIHISMLPKV